MSAISITVPQTPPAPSAPELHELNAHPREEARAISTANKVGAFFAAVVAAGIITFCCLALPYPSALVFSLIAGAITIACISAILSDCNSTVIVHDRPSRTYFWDHWRPSYSYYSPPVVVNPIYRRSSPIIVDSTPHVRVGGGHSFFSPVRTQPHIRVGGGHSAAPRSIPPMRSGGGFGFNGHSGGPRVAVGSRRH